MSWTEAEAYFKGTDTAILPTGAVEQHGPQNPLGADYLVASRISEIVAEKTGVICLPAVPYGVSPHHRQFWGTIYLSRKTFMSMIMGICLSLKEHGVTKLLIINGHGGNRDSLSACAEELRRKHGMFVAIFQWWEASRRLLPDLFNSEEREHAGAEETSVNLVLHPELIKPDRAVDNLRRQEGVIVRKSGLYVPFDTKDVSDSGVWSKSSGIDREKGQTVVDAVISEAVEYVTKLKAAKTADLLPKPHL